MAPRLIDRVWPFERRYPVLRYERPRPWAFLREPPTDTSPDMAPKPKPPPEIIWHLMYCKSIPKVAGELAKKGAEYRARAESYRALGIEDLARQYEDMAEEYYREASEGMQHYESGNCINP